jgi:ABC-type sugar transport system ATPase subunit
MSEVLLRIQGLSKSFGSTLALSDVSFDIEAGEIHALVGENGAGKSTLVNVLSGVVEPDAGAISVAGTNVRFGSPRAAQRAGVATVHQELSLAEPLSVAENVFAGRLPSFLGLVDRKRLHEETRALFGRIGVAIDPAQTVGELPISSRQITEIAKALAINARVILLDEPTSALNTDEKQALFSLVRRVKARGVGLVFISHHLEEVMDLSDRVSVMRDGRLVATYQTAQVSSSQLVRNMVGREIADNCLERRPAGDNTRLVVRDAGRRGEFENVSFALREGEIGAIAGLMGSGRSEVAAALAGARPLETGAVTLDGAPLDTRSVASAKRSGVGFIPAERKTEGLFLDLPIDVNIAAASLPKWSRFGLWRFDLVREMAGRYVEALRIRSRDTSDLCRALSGGNQQKVLFAKWLEAAPKVLIIDEPTKGVDIATKLEIYRQMTTLAARGASILFVSSDLPEMLSVSHRLLVMYRGRITAELSAENATEHQVIEFASGLARRAA